MACRLSEDQVEALYSTVLGDIVATKNRGDIYDPNTAIRTLYQSLMAAGADQTNALDYIQHVPRMINAAYGSLEEIADYLQDSNVSIDNLNKMRRDFKDINNVMSFLELNNNTLEVIEEILEESNPSTPVVPTDVYTEIENSDVEEKKKLYNNRSFIAAPETALAVFNQEAQDYDGAIAEDNIADPDPKKKTYYAVVRKINALMNSLNASTANNLKMGTTTGIYMSLVKASSIDDADLYVSDTKFINQSEQNRANHNESAVALLYTDKNGKVLYFDEEGNITSKEAGGRLVYGKIRNVYSDARTGNKYVPRVQTVERKVEKGMGTQEDLQAERQKEMDVLEGARKFLKENPTGSLMFSITPGRNGYVNEDFSTINTIGSIQLPDGFKPTVAKEDTGIYKSGGVYFHVPGYSLPILVRRPKFSQLNNNLAENLADLLFDSANNTQSNAEKIAIVKQFTYSNDTKVFERDGKIFVKQGEQELDTTVAANRETFLQNLNGQTVNINKDLVNGYVDMPVNLDGKVQIQKEIYNNFLTGNFYTHLAKNAEGKVVSMNAYNNIFPTAESQTKIFGETKTTKTAPVSLTEATPTDNKVSPLAEMLKNADFSLKKSILENSDATEEQIAKARAWYTSSPLAKVVPFETMFHVVNSNALATFTLSGITLFQGSNYTDLYHEGWHAFSQLFLTRDQKVALYGETRKLTGSFKTADGRTIKFSAASDIQLEEFLAEDYRKYAMADGKYIVAGRGARNTVFRRILNFLKAVFKGYSIKDAISEATAIPKIGELYEKLYIGNINDYSASLNNVQFKILNKGAQPLDDKNIDGGLNYQDSMTLVETIDSLMASTLQDYGVNLGVLFTNPEFTAPLYSEIKNKLQNMLNAPDLSESSKRILNFTLNEWGDYGAVSKGEQELGVIAFHKKRSSYLTFDEKYSDLTGAEQDINENAADVVKDEDNQLSITENEARENFGTNAFERKGNELSVRELASNQTVYLIKSLPALDKNGKVVMNALGVPKLTDFNRTWGVVINTVQGAIDEVDMYKKLSEASTRFPELKALVERLGDPMEKTQTSDWPAMNMWINFHRDFSVYRVPIREVRIVKSEVPGEEGSTFSVEFTETNPTFKQVENTFKSQFDAIRNNKYVRNTPQGNQLNIESILNDFPKSTLLSGTAKLNSEQAIKFLRAIGLYMTDNQAVRESLNENYTAVTYLHSALSRINYFNSSKEAGSKITINSPIDFLRNELKNVTTKDSKGNTTLLHKGESSNIEKLLNIEGNNSGKYSNNSVENVNGDSVFDLSLNNTVTKQFAELNAAGKNYTDIIGKPHMAHLDFRNNPAAKYSIWMNSMFHIPTGNFETANMNQRRVGKTNAETVTIDIVNLDGIKEVVSNEAKAQFRVNGIKTTSADPATKFIMDLHTMLLRGVIEAPRHASKSTAYGYSVSLLNTPFNAKSRHLYISSEYFADDATANNATVAMLKPKIASEMERIAMLKAGMLPNIPGFNERGLTFTMFDDILSDGLKAELIDMADPNNSLDLLEDAELTKRISNDISRYINNLTQENLTVFGEMPFISKDILRGGARGSAKSITSLVGAGANLTDAQLKVIALKSFTVNALIHNMEGMAMVYGDLAMYNHNKEEFHKRNAAVGSTGRIFASGQATTNFVNNLGRAYARKIGATERTFDGTINSVIFKDNNVPSVYYNEYLDALVAKGYTKEQAASVLKPYSEMNEGDAQGWVTFDSYRMFSILEGAWSEKQNDLYNKIINEEEVDPKEISEFFPTKKFQYAGPVKSDKLHLQAFHKFSLVPLIPSLIKGTNMQTVHDNLVKQQVDYALFESGSKLATVTKNGQYDDLYTNKEERTTTPWKQGDPEFTTNKVFIQYLKDQVDIQSTWKNKTIFSTQLRKLIINDLFKQGVATSKDFEKLVTDFEGLLDDFQTKKKNELLAEAGWTQDKKGNYNGSVKSLMDFVERELARQELPEHDIDFVRESSDINSIKRDLSFSLNAEKIEKLLNSIVIKRLVRQKMNGEQLVQVSGAGFESTTKLTNPTEEDIKNYRGTNDLPTYRPGKGKDGKTSAMKVKIAMKGDYYKLLELKHIDGEKIGTRERLNEMLKKDEWLDQEDRRKLITMVGVRIPVQGLNSMEFMEVYEFLPEEAGSIVIPPAEIVAKSGSDFDIDKLTIFQPNYSKNSKQAKYSTNDNVKGTENKIIEKIRQILEHPDNFEALIRPNNTDIVKGVADNLASKNVQGYNPLANKTRETANKISPTRTLEPRYNLYKHESNNIGKKTLGIGAVDNAYSSIFKRIGARLESQYTHYPIDFETGEYKRDKKTGKIVQQIRPINIKMKHNSMTVNGKSYISLSDINTTTGEKISDLISQLMNGWVDIEKDAWIFNINGNNVAGPVLLFMIESGVDFKTAAHFISQPLIVDYIKQRAASNSPFFEASGKGENKGKGLNKFNIKKQFILDNFEDDLPINKSTGEPIVSNDGIYKIINKYNDGVEYTSDNLLDVIENKDTTSDMAKAALLHFFELEDLMSQLTNIKLTVNLDTAPSKSLFSAQERLSKIAKLNIVDAVPSDMVKKILYDSPIKSFLVQAFQLKLWEPLMKLRGDVNINNFLIDKIATKSYTNSFDDAEKYVATFKNDLPLYLLQNYLKGMDITKITEYKGLLIDKAIPVQNVQIKNGAYVKEGVMYVDVDQIKSDFASMAYTDKGTYKESGLAVLPAQAFKMGETSANFQEYSNYVLEREYLRSILPVRENETRESYENRLRDRALERTFNFYTMLKSDNSIADEFNRIKDKYSEELKDYLIFDQLGYSPGSKFDVNKLKTLKLKSSKLDSEIANVLHENLQRLADPGTIKVQNPVSNAEISKFFSRMIISEYLRAGISKTNDSIAMILPSESLMKLLEEPMSEISKQGLTDEFLEKYSSLFDSNWSKSATAVRNRFRNYIQTSRPTMQEAITEATAVTPISPSIASFKNKFAKSELEPILNANKNTIFVYPVNENGTGDNIAKVYSDAGNSAGVVLKAVGKNWTDDTYDSNIGFINQSLDVISAHLNNGFQVAFPEFGLNLTKVKEESVDFLTKSAPRTFDHLATELYKRFGYVHPGAEQMLGFRKEFQSNQPISDQEIDAAINKKIEESKNCNS